MGFGFEICGVGGYQLAKLEVEKRRAKGEKLGICANITQYFEIRKKLKNEKFLNHIKDQVKKYKALGALGTSVSAKGKWKLEKKNLDLARERKQAIKNYKKAFDQFSSVCQSSAHSWLPLRQRVSYESQKKLDALLDRGNNLFSQLQDLSNFVGGPELIDEKIKELKALMQEIRNVPNEVASLEEANKQKIAQYEQTLNAYDDEETSENFDSIIGGDSHEEKRNSLESTILPGSDACNNDENFLNQTGDVLVDQEDGDWNPNEESDLFDSLNTTQPQNFGETVPKNVDFLDEESGVDFLSSFGLGKNLVINNDDEDSLDET